MAAGTSSGVGEEAAGSLHSAARAEHGVNWNGELEFNIVVRGPAGQGPRTKLDLGGQCLTVNETGARSLIPSWNSQNQEKCDKVKQGDRIFRMNGVEGSGKELMNQLLLSGTLDLELRRTLPFRSPGSLEDLLPPYGFNKPSLDNSKFILLRSKTDANIVKSVQGFNGHQVWASSPKENQKLTDLWSVPGYHLFMVIAFRDKAFGLARMSSAPDREQYGGYEFWGVEYAYLGANFKLQWIKECVEPLASCDHSPPLETMADGTELDPHVGFDFAIHLLWCEQASHATRRVIRTDPGRVAYKSSFSGDVQNNPRKNFNVQTSTQPRQTLNERGGQITMYAISPFG